MGSTGKVALSVIMGIGAVTGILCYYAFTTVAPEPGAASPVGTLETPPSSTLGGVESKSDGPQTTSTTSADGTGNVTTSNATDINESTAASGNASGITGPEVSLNIPQGASVQGNQAFDPDPLTVKVGDTIAVDNQDTVPHTVTNGKDATDPDMGKLFDTSIINSGESAQIVTADLEPGQYPYFCAVHPYMVGTLEVQ